MAGVERLPGRLRNPGTHADAVTVPIGGSINGSERGYTIVELLVAMTLGIVVLGAVVSSYVSQLGSSGESVSRADSVRELIPGVDRMTREIRSATYVQITGGNQIDLQTPWRGGSTTSGIRRVVYLCASGKCTRDQGAAGLGSALSGSPTTVIDRVGNADVFTPASGTFTGGTVATSPYVTIKLDVEISEGSSGRQIQFNDGVTLRNVPTS